MSAEGMRWVTCSQELSWDASRYRHLIWPGYETTRCGCSGMPANVWRGNTSKPECPACVKATA